MIKRTSVKLACKQDPDWVAGRKQETGERFRRVWTRASTSGACRERSGEEQKWWCWQCAASTRKNLVGQLPG